MIETLSSYVAKNIPSGWEELFSSSKKEIQNISDILDGEVERRLRIVPNQEDIFKVFQMCKPQDIKVCIVAMEPYPQVKPDSKPVATGLAFSTDIKDDANMSTKNIYKEIQSCYPDSEIPIHGDLSQWVSQGVFLLNICLTCRAGEFNSHSKYKLWMPFMDKFIKFLAGINKDCIFVLWGNDAQKLESTLEKNFRNILKTSHPSGNSSFRGFFGCNHFKIINDILVTQKRKEIEWLPKKPSVTNLKIKLILEIMKKEELDFLVNYYESYYKENKHQSDNLGKLSLQEYVVYILTMTIFSESGKTQSSYDDFLTIIIKELKLKGLQLYDTSKSCINLLN
jgi:uracil-DNA glycosylase